MAENKMGPNLQAGAGFLAKRVQKSFNRAQEKVLQKLGKTMETKDEHFELCLQNLNRQQTDGNRLFKDVRAYYNAVKVVHETSKRLSQTLRDIYESDWFGVEGLGVITESEDLLWNDFEEKLSDQIVRTMENYTAQFPEVKDRVSKRGRKLVDYDSSRHHLEALQNAKKKDEAKINKAEEEFNKAQNVFEEINKELREELPVLHQSRIGCYVTVFQNISNLRDVFYKEMSVLNRELYDVMKQLETQHSTTEFIIKGLESKSKKRKSVVISNPIPCNTAFPDDHVSLHSSGENGKSAVLTSPGQRIQSVSEESSAASKRSSSFSDSDISSNGGDSPRRQSVNNPEGDDIPGMEEEEEADEGLELGGPVDDDAVAAAAGDDEASDPPQEEKKTKPPPVPAPRLSSQSSDKRPAPPDEEQTVEVFESPKPTEQTRGNISQNPPGFQYKVVALESHEASEEGELEFEKGDIILVLFGGDDSQEPDEEMIGITEKNWLQHQDVVQHSGLFSQSLVGPVQAD